MRYMQTFLLSMLLFRCASLANATPLKAVLTTSPLDTAKTIEDSESDIDLHVASNGGFINQFRQLIDVMDSHKNQGYKINCYIDHAYSAAFIAIDHCSARYVTPKSTLMFHYTRTPIPANIVLTAADLAQLLHNAEHDDEWMVYDVAYHTRLPEWFLRYNFARETMWTGEQVHNMAPEFFVMIPEVTKK